MRRAGPRTTMPAADWGWAKLTVHPERLRATRSAGHEVAPVAPSTPTLGGVFERAAPSNRTVARSRSWPRYQVRLVAVPDRGALHAGSGLGSTVGPTWWARTWGTTRRVESRSGTKTPCANAHGSINAMRCVPVAFS